MSAGTKMHKARLSTGLVVILVLAVAILGVGLVIGLAQATSITDVLIQIALILIVSYVLGWLWISRKMITTKLFR
mgnify:CR=1 FL=1